MQEPRLLIISHNIIDSSNNVGKTVISLLKHWPRKNVRSIYLRNEIRNTMLCDDSYMITDMDIIHNSYKFSSQNCGNRVTITDKQKAKSGNEGAYRLGNKRYPIISLARDILWHKQSWKNEEINHWIKEFKPDLILFIPNDYVLAFEIADYVKQLTGVPMITFFTDDSFYYNQKTSIIDSLRRKWLLKVGKRIVEESSGMICASDLMRKEYKVLFGKDSIVLGNCVEISNIEMYTKTDESESFVFSYIGNLHSNRWKALIEIGQCLDVINESNNKKCVLNVYSASDLGEKVWNTIRNVQSICVKGSVPAAEVKSIQEGSDALVHIEAFDWKSKLSTRLSMSTKIFEYMARNKPIFAYGPDDISSISFLRDGDFATVCSSSNELARELRSFVSDGNKRNKSKDQAYKYARDNFEEDIVSHRFMDYSLKVINENYTR